MLWLEQKYMALASVHLKNCKRKSSELWNFSCPICGDSATNGKKARGYVYSKAGNLIFHCHNCGVTKSAPNLIKHLDERLYLEFVKERAEVGRTSSPLREAAVAARVTRTPRPSPDSTGFKKLSQLPRGHFAIEYVRKRNVPPEKAALLGFVPKFMEWTNTLVPDKFTQAAIDRFDEPRLILPLLDEDGKMVGFQGRSFATGDDVVRYVTVMIDHDAPRIFGMDRLRRDKPYLVLEGPIDSLFLDNAIATAGGTPTIEVSKAGLRRDIGTFVLDNEPRNRDTVAKMKKAIDEGYGVVIWPSWIREKDVNDMILAGETLGGLTRIIREKTYRGPLAHAQIGAWSR